MRPRGFYHRTWNSYFAWCEARGFHPHTYVLGRILAVLQSGVDQGLALRTIKGQVSAFFRDQLLHISLLHVFVEGVTPVVPQGTQLGTFYVAEISV